MLLARNPTDSTTALLGWIREFPAPGLDADTANRLLTTVIRGGDSVVELVDGERRIGLFAVVDTCTSAHGSADLAWLGLDRTHMSGPGLATVIRVAERLVLAGPLDQLDVTLPDDRVDWSRALEGLGYRAAYGSYTMHRDAAPIDVRPRAPLPPDWRFEPLTRDRLIEYHSVVTAAFAGVPGAFVSSPESMASALDEAPIEPQMLLGDGRIQGFCSVHVHHRSGNRIGEVVSLGRAPQTRGLGLGDHLLGRALELLADHAPDAYELGVSAANPAALDLYRRYGFVVTESWHAFRRALRAPSGQRSQRSCA